MNGHQTLFGTIQRHVRRWIEKVNASGFDKIETLEMHTKLDTNGVMRNQIRLV